MDIKTSSTAQLTDDQRLDWLRLIRSDNVGPRGIMAQTPQDISTAPPKWGNIIVGKQNDEIGNRVVCRTPTRTVLPTARSTKCGSFTLLRPYAAMVFGQN